MKKLILFILPLLMLSCVRYEDDGEDLSLKKGYFVRYESNGELIEDHEIWMPSSKTYTMFSRIEQGYYPSHDHYRFILAGIRIHLLQDDIQIGSYEYNPNDENGILNHLSFRTADYHTRTEWEIIGSPTDEFYLNITEVTEEYCKGNFSGKIKVYESSFSTSVVKYNHVVELTIANGEFFIPFGALD